MITSVEQAVEFLKKYHAPLLREDPPRRIAGPNFEIPASLKLIYDTFGHHVGKPQGPLSTQDLLLPAQQLVEKDGAVTFVMENQNCWTCAYDPNAPDNPVYVYNGHEPLKTLITDSIDQFLVTFTLYEAVMSSPWLRSNMELSPGTLNSVNDVKLPLQALHRGRYPIMYEGNPIEFWITEDQKVIFMNFTSYDELWLGSYCEKGLVGRNWNPF